VGYIPLTNYKYDLGLHQIQSGPNHESFLVVSSGIVDVGADLGVIVPGPPDHSYADIYNAQITTYLNVKVANPGAGNIFYIDNEPQAVLQLRRNQTFILDQSDPSNAGHPFRFSTTSNGTHNGGVQYTVGVTTNGTPGTPNSYTQIVVADSAPSLLYYYCAVHANMGGSAVVATVNSTQWYKSTAFRAAPQIVSGYWIDYTPGVAYQPSGALSAEEGYRPLGFSTIAYAKVQTSFSSNFGVRQTLPYTYFGGVAPDNQGYSPYKTPDSNTVAEGITGGGVTHGRYEGGLLTTAVSSGVATRADWTYNPPVYCRTYTEATRAQVPGLMSAVIRTIYRGGSTRYVSNLGSVYFQGSEGVRNIVRTFSASVNSSNQKG